MKYEVNFSGGFYLTADEDKIEEDFETVKKEIEIALQKVGYSTYCHISTPIIEFEVSDEIEEYQREMTDKEYILCSAIKRITPRPETQLRNNDIHLIEIGYRHCDIYHRFRGELSHNPDDQGFYTSKGRFVNREEAYEIAERARQIINPHPQKGCLYSEDLY